MVRIRIQMPLQIPSPFPFPIPILVVAVIRMMWMDAKGRPLPRKLKAPIAKKSPLWDALAKKPSASNCIANVSRSRFIVEAIVAVWSAPMCSNLKPSARMRFGTFCPGIPVPLIPNFKNIKMPSKNRLCIKRVVVAMVELADLVVVWNWRTNWDANVARVRA